MKRYAPNIEDDMTLWQLVPTYATLHELRTVYSLGDALDMIERKNLEAAARALPPPQAQPRGGW